MKPLCTVSVSRGCLLMLTGILMLMGLPAYATKTFQPLYNPTLSISRITQEINVDGDLDDPGWASAQMIGSFVERSPGDMIEADVETKVLITFDDDNLYVAFKCYDDPESIRATMCHRDQFGGDDAVCVLIDTYGDASWAYEFFVNPYGVQKDRLWSSVGGEDSGFDMIWRSAAKITESGYQVEIAIPFEAMRFPDTDSQTWKMDFWRNRPRESFKQYSWAAYDRNEQCWPCQWGTVSGITNVSPGRGFELLPAFVAYRSGELSDPTNTMSPFDYSPTMGEFSLGSKYSITSNIIAEASYNPDFSQIEADASQIDVNSTIALFYPERRPFFQEGRDIFRTMFNSFYTRTVNDPQYAVKITGRPQTLTFGLLSARDDNSPYMIPLDQGSIVLNTGKSYVNVVRSTLSIGNDSKLGAIITDRRFEDDGSGTILALDGDIRLSQTYSIAGQFLGSHSREPDNPSMTKGFHDVTFADGKHTLGFNGESYFGNALITNFHRNARHFNFFLDYNQISPTYRTQTGYDPINNHRSAAIGSYYRFYFDHPILDRITPQTYIFRRWSYHGGQRKIESHNFAIDINTKVAQSGFGINFNHDSEEWRGERFDNLRSGSISFNSRPLEQISFYAQYFAGDGIARRSVVRAKEKSFYLGLNLKPIDRIIIEPSFDYQQSSEAETGEELYEGYIARARTRIQANRRLSLRLVLEYNDFAQNLAVEPLVTYRLSPFSVFYIGSSHNLDYEFRGDNSVPDERSRQYFMKLQYLFQS